VPKPPTQPTSADECVKTYLERLPTDDAPRPLLSLLLTAYLAWPNDAERRNSFIATHLVRFGRPSDEKASHAPADSDATYPLEVFGGINAVAKVAFVQLTTEISQVRRKWLLTADIFQVIVDMAFDKRIALRRGASISKAIDLCEVEHGLRGHSQLWAAWSEFRDVAHVLTAGAYLAHEGLRQARYADEASILNAIWIAPDLVVALAYGLQEFGLQPKPIRKEVSILKPDTLWRVPDCHKPEKPFVVFRRLTEDQLVFLNSRPVAKKVA
jgi:hypothetical protein